MSKYNKGDTINLQLIIDDKQHNFNNGTEYWIDVDSSNTTDGMWLTEEQLDKYSAKTYEQGLEDAWELAKKVYEMKSEEFDKVFGCVHYCDMFYYFTSQEALAKLEAYEKEQAIKVGDVVRIQGTNFEYLVTHIEVDKIGKKYYCGISKGGKGLVQDNVEKTGKHIDISSILEQIGGGE